MRNPEKCNVEYVGYKNPDTADEVYLEILGLELAIKIAEQRIALLKQSTKMAEMQAKSSTEE